MSKKIRNSSTQAKDLWDFLLIFFKKTLDIVINYY